MLSVGDFLINQDQVEIRFMNHPVTKGCVGALVSFRHWNFFINLSDIDFTSFMIKSKTGNIFGGRHPKPVYRIGAFDFKANEKVSGEIKFGWQ